MQPSGALCSDSKSSALFRLLLVGNLCETGILRRVWTSWRLHGSTWYRRRGEPYFWASQQRTCLIAVCYLCGKGTVTLLFAWHMLVGLFFNFLIRDSSRLSSYSVSLDPNPQARIPTLALAQVRAELYKLSSLSLCSNTIGQLATGIMINPPKPGDPSFETFKKVGTVLHTFK